MKFYQACFGKPNNVSWSLFNVSSDIPANLSSFYEKSENSNTPQNLDKDDMVDKSGNPLCIYEILSQENIVAVSKIQYGSRDNMGRPKMFAHGFLFDETTDVFTDPNSILSISDVNFKFDIDETKNIPDTLVMDKRYTLQEAMGECNISNSNLIKLMACVYISLTSTTDFPLYIVCENNNVILKPLAYCIYSLLPYSLRYNLSVSNANNFSRAQFKNIMIVDKKYDNGYYYDMTTNETNVDLSDIKNHSEKYPFIYRMNKNGINEFENYCIKLNSELEKMQLKNTRDYNIVKLADVLMGGTGNLERYDDQEITRFLIEISTYAPMQNNYIDTFVSQVAENYYSRGLIPNEALMRRLQVRGEKTSSEAFVNIYKQLQMKTLMQNGTDAVIKFLIEQRQVSWERFVEWCRYIEKIEDGVSIIEKYYSIKISNAMTLQDVLKLYEECTKLISFAHLYNIANERCYAITKNKIIDKSEAEHDLSSILDEYSNVFSMINVSKGASERQNNIEKLIFEYWKNFDINNFEFTESCISNCQCMEPENNINPMYLNVTMLVRIYSFFEDNNKIGIETLDGMYADVKYILNQIERNSGFSYSELKNIIPKIQNYIVNKLKCSTGYTKRNFMFWWLIASYGNQITEANPFKLMIEWRLPIIIDEKVFRDAMCDEIVEEHINKLINALEGEKYKRGYIDDFDNKSEEYKLLSKRLSIMYELKKEIGKRNKKEEAKARKEERQKSKFDSYEDDEDADFRDPYAHSDDEDDFHTPYDDRGDMHRRRESGKKGFSISKFFGGNGKKRNDSRR